MTKILYPFMIS